MISILFQTETHFPVDRKKIKESVARALETKVNSNAEVSISIIGDRRMRELNRTYRKLDKTTDVLSFPLNDPAYTDSQFVDPPDNVLHLGDIIVSYPQAVEEATEENTLVDDMIIRLVLHGLDHLLGIHHEENHI